MNSFKHSEVEMRDPSAADLNASHHGKVLPPPIALWLGVLGLIPFLASAAISLFAGTELQAAAHPYLIGYATAILSFMGGVHWWLAMGWTHFKRNKLQQFQFAVSVVPALAAWMTFFLPQHIQIVWLSLCFLLLLAFDFRSIRIDLAPKWYPALRWPLTLTVLACLSLAALPLDVWFDG
jgi:hypothetical protein